MSLKRTLFIILLAISILVFSIYASPVRRAEIGKKVSVTLHKLDATITFEQVGVQKVTTFAQLGIEIQLPGTKPFKATGPGVVDILVGQTLEITKDKEVLDSGILV
ncbi:1029_t:CDS:2 [Acaulospora morrowiae]|uniref:1029_t:CDS:1 n=1 Tax=Acaulospora morrowiae TaxID=94023 RepID=A0A9N9F8P5_9GLOM|nr:1029_t:CDS:2 [Acaulospora morrowiae]